MANFGILDDDADAIQAMHKLLSADKSQLDRVLVRFHQCLPHGTVRNAGDEHLLMNLMIPASERALKAARDTAVNFTTAEQVANALIAAAPHPLQTTETKQGGRNGL